MLLLRSTLLILRPHFVVGASVFRVSSLPATSNVDRLARRADGLSGIVQHVIQAVKLVLLLCLRLSLVHGLRHGQGVLLAAAKAVKVITQVADLIASLGKQTACPRTDG